MMMMIMMMRIRDVLQKESIIYTIHYNDGIICFLWKINYQIAAGITAGVVASVILCLIDCCIIVVVGIGYISSAFCNMKSNDFA